MHNVCFVVQRYGLEVNGGAELLCRQLAERLTDRYDITVLTTKAISYITWANEYPSDEEDINGVHVRRFPTDQPRDMRRFKPLNALLNRGILPRHLQDRWFEEQGPLSTALIDEIAHTSDQFDAFIFNTYLYYPTVFGLPQVAAKSVLIPDAHEEPALHLTRVREEIESAAAIFFNASEEQALVQKTFNVAHIPQEIGGAGVDISPHPSVATFRKKYAIDNPYVVYVGRIDEAKGCGEMFRLWGEYKASHPGDLELVLMGKPAMRIPSSSDIHALGYISDEDKYAGMEGAGLLWLPSEHESLSLVVLESLALGVPVLVNGASDVLRGHCTRSGAGLWYTDETSFASAVGRLLEGGADVKAMRAAGPRYVAENYRWDVIIAKLSRMIDGLR